MIMAKDDYYVLAYRILAYLYLCLKEGEIPDQNYIGPDSETLNISRNYWEYIMAHLYQDGYLEGIALVPTVGKVNPGIKILRSVMITPKGIEFLQDNSAMSKAREFLKTLKETIPGL